MLNEKETNEALEKIKKCWYKIALTFKGTMLNWVLRFKRKALLRKGDKIRISFHKALVTIKSEHFLNEIFTHKLHSDKGLLRIHRNILAINDMR